MALDRRNLNRTILAHVLAHVLAHILENVGHSKLLNVPETFLSRKKSRPSFC